MGPWEDYQLLESPNHQTIFRVRSKTHLISCWYWVSTSLLKRDRYNPLLEYRISLSLSRSSTEAEGEQKSYSIHRINYDIA